MNRILTVAFVVSIIACNSTQQSGPKTPLESPPHASGRAMNDADLHDADEAVIAVVVREVIMKDPRVTRTGAALIEDQSIGNVLLRDYPPTLNYDTERLYEAALARNTTRVHIKCSSCPSDAIIVDASQLAQHARAADRRNYLDQIKKGSYGTYSFHLPGYDGDLALVQYVWVAGELAMEGVWVLAKRTADGWHIVEAKRTWAA